MYYKIASILLNSERQKDSISDVFIAQPDAFKEDLIGKLFILAEIQSPKNEAGKILSFLINNLNYNYYQNEKAFLKERVETISAESIFESALAKTNADLVEFLTEEKIKISPYAFNITACILCKNELYFSNTGKNKNFLLFKEKVPTLPTHVSSRKNVEEPEKIEYKISDVGQNQESGSETINLNKLFSEVTGGKIPAGGYFIIINEAMSEYLSNKQLLKIITNLSPAGAVEQIKNILEQINSVVSFLGIIVKNTSATNFSNEELRKKIAEEIKDFEYQPEITVTEKQTEMIMKPSGIIDFKKWFGAIIKKMKPERKITPSVAPSGKESLKRIFLSKSSVFFKKKSSLFSWKKIIDALKKIGEFLVAIPSGIIKLKNLFSKNINNKSTVVSKRTKYILIAIGILILAFTINLFITETRNKQNEKIRNFNTLVSNVEKNQNKIEADLLYGNETEALQLLNENKNSLAQIPAKEVAKREQVQTLISKQSEQMEKVGHIMRIGSVNKTADFSPLNSGANPLNLFFFKNTLYSADTNGKSIYKVDLKQNMATAINNLPSDINELRFPSTGLNNSLDFLGANGITELDSADQSKKLAITLPASLDDIISAEAYSDKLYMLNRKDGQVYRYSRATDNFGSQTTWLNSSVDLSSAVDMAIDGNIYILYKNGQVEKYLRGAKTEFSLPEINEPITEANRLIVTKNYIYILESAKKRLIVFSSKGAFVEQDIFETLANVKDFSIDETAKKVYLLSDASVYDSPLGFIK